MALQMPDHLHPRPLAQAWLQTRTSWVRSFFTKTNERVDVCKVRYWVEEQGKWVRKADDHTFWPTDWDVKKNHEKILEASKNIKKVNGRFFWGVTDDGIEIQIIIDKQTKEIETAFITG